MSAQNPHLDPNHPHMDRCSFFSALVQCGQTRYAIAMLPETGAHLFKSQITLFVHYTTAQVTTAQVTL